MISTAAELTAALVKYLPPHIRSIVEAHCFDGESIFKIQRQRKMKRRNLEALIEATLVTMQEWIAATSGRFRAVADVI